MARTGLFTRRTAAEDRAAEASADPRTDDKRLAATETVRIPATTTPTADRRVDRAGGDTDTGGAPPALVESTPRAHTSLMATLALIVGLSAGYAAMSGRLAPVGVALGVLGLLLAIGGLTAVAHPGVTGHSVVIFGLLFSVAGIVLGVMAINGALPWLDTEVDQADRVRDWLDSYLPWMNRW